MSATFISEKQILEALHRLDPSRWDEVLDFISYVQHRASAQTAAPPCTARDLLQSELVGLWADRADIGDSLTFARQLREQAERRNPADAV